MYEKKDDPRRNHPHDLLELLAEVTGQQSGEGLAMSGLIAGHFI